MSKLVAVAVATILAALIPVDLEWKRGSLTLKNSSAYAFAASADLTLSSYSDGTLNDRAVTVLEVVLNEMAGSGVVGRQAAFLDALNIASVVANRAESAGLTQQAIVSVRQEFNGYGIPMRPGAERDLSLAKQAIEQVSAHGPVHKAMFYATPPSTKYLPSGLKPVAQTAGHIFFVDPLRRSYKTAKGYVRPDPSFFTYYSALLHLDMIEPADHGIWMAYSI